MEKFKIANSIRENKFGFYFTLPALLFMLFFISYPIARTLYLSFHTYNPIQSNEIIFVGLENYKWLFNEPNFLNSLSITLIFTILSVIIEAIVGLSIALLLDIFRSRGTISSFISKIVLSVFIIPWALPGIAAGVVWKLLYHPTFGLINSILGRDIRWLSEKYLALFSLIVADAWKTFPFFLIIFFAAITSMSKEQSEAARTDGANWLQELRYITLPSMFPIIVIAIVFRAIDAFTKIFDLVYILTGGGPGRATEVLPLLIYNTGLRFFRFGTASALSIVVMLFSFLFGIWLFRRRR